MNRLFILFIFIFCLACRVAAQDTLALSSTPVVTQEQQEKIDAAFTAMVAVQQAGNYIKSLTELLTAGNLTLPVGIKNGGYELVVREVTYNPQSDNAVIKASCAFELKQSGQRIAFEGTAVVQSDNGFGNRSTLELVAPIALPLGKAASLTIRQGTAVSFGCEGVDVFTAKMRWEVRSPNIIACNSEGKPTGGKLASDFDARFTDFDDFIVSLNVNQSFTFKGLSDFVFTIKGATLDQSEVETSAMTVFPEGYVEAGDERNQWRGVSVTELAVMLPPVFKLPDGGRISLAMKNVLFDGNGFTGRVEASNVLNGALLDLESWGISLNDIIIGFMRDVPVEIGFGGEMNIPPFGRNSLVPYTASYNMATETLEFMARIHGTYELPVIRSTLELAETSGIDIRFSDGGIYPTITANGRLTVHAPVNQKDTTKKFDAGGIAFEGMKISREAPYLKIGYIGLSGDLVSPKVAGFQLSLEDIHAFDEAKGGGLAFAAQVSLNEMFGGGAGLRLYGDYSRWRFSHLALDSVNIFYHSDAFSLDGSVSFMNGDDVYGDGFGGRLHFNILKKFDLKAKAVFGKKDDYRYFLTDVFLELDPKMGIPVPPGLSFYGFGGGLYRHMQQADASNPGSDFAKSLSGIRYVPDRAVGMGFMASTKFGLMASPDAFNAKVGFEMQFNSNWGLNFVQFSGSLAVMDSWKKWGGMIENVQKAVAKVDPGGKIAQVKKDDLQNRQPENKGTSFLSASVNMRYDLNNNIFTADMSAWLNVAGLITGAGAGNRLGWASAYFAPDKWYTYLGTPSDRLGIKVLNLATLDGYFMIGNDIPGLPLPPDKVMRELSASKQAQLKRGNSSDLTFGKGIAFGAGLNVDFKATLPPFYAAIGAGLGTEFLLVNMKGYTCENHAGTPGINGWFAAAQAWAYVDAAIGIEAKVFRKKRKFDILEIGAATLLEGSGPNPLYFSGAVGGHYSVLGGLISGRCSFDFEIGEKCIIKREGNPFGEDIIAQLTPASDAEDVNVFAAPQAVFNIAVEKPMTIQEDDGSRATYKVTLEDFSVVDATTGKPVVGRSSIAPDGNVTMLDPDEPFESQRQYTVHAKVGFARMNGNRWERIADEKGTPVFEELSAKFKTGDRPKEIMPEHVAYSYPVSRQYNFYPDEHAGGYIALTENYSYLFTTDRPEGFDQRVRFSDATGVHHELTFTYTTANSGQAVRMTIGFDMGDVPFAGERIYKLAIVNIPRQANADMSSNVSTVTNRRSDDVDITTRQAEGSLTMLAEKEIYSYSFRSSRYQTFAAKMEAFNTKAEGWIDYEEPYVDWVKANLKGTELFDKYEMTWDDNVNPLIRFEAQLGSTEWFSASAYNGVYTKNNIPGIVQNRNDTRDFGNPPAKAISVITSQSPELTDEEIATGQAKGYSGIQGIIRYELPYWCARDFYYLRNELAVRKAAGRSLTTAEAALLAKDHPELVTYGGYPVKASYILPGTEAVSSTVEKMMWNPVK